MSWSAGDCFFRMVAVAVISSHSSVMILYSISFVVVIVCVLMICMFLVG